MSRPTIVRHSRAEFIQAGGPLAVLQPAGRSRTGSKYSSYRRIAAAGKLGTALRGTLAGAFVLAAITIAAPGAQAQETGILNPGDAVVTGFSGAVGPDEGADALDHTYIDTDGASVRVIGLGATGGPAEGQLIPAPKTFEVTAGQVGQVFGAALDDGIREDTDDRVPNAYVAATSAYGLSIVGDDADGDGAPDRAKTGQAGASWMAGQFGTEEGGGPGSIWKIDGVTGEVSLFADITLDGVANSGPGLGNIAYDADNRQLFVSDLDTGMIVRVDLDGNVLDHFDHGVEARAAAGLEEVAFDPANRLDISSPAFNSEDSETWQFTDARRRIHGLAVHEGRLYYSVTEGPQIWSVGLTEDGGFGDDARTELDLAGQVVPFAVTDLAFGADGSLTLAQRGGVTGSYDYRSFTVPGQARVLRFAQDESGTWSPAPSEYAVGLSGEFRNVSGGIAFGNGYDAEGFLDPAAFAQTLWSTGDGLLGDAAAVSGLQGNDEALVRPQNEPPVQSYFVDLDDQYDDVQATGHAGDVEIVPFGAGEPVVAEGPVYTDDEPVITPIDTPFDDVPGFGDPGFGDPGFPPGFPSCPPGTKWNPILKKCVPFKWCPPGTKWNPILKKCVPFKWCPPGTKWNPILKKCVPIKICPPGTKWNPILKKCVPFKWCPPGKKWNPILKKCVPIIKFCPLGKKWNPILKKCVPICPLNKKWNPITKKCEPFVIQVCPKGSIWNPVLKKCIKISIHCLPGFKYDWNKKKCVPICPPGHKWSANLKKCVPIIVLPPKCPAGTKWSANLKKCVPIIVLPPKCPAGTKWSANLKKCVPIIVLPPKCPAGTKWSANLKKCVPIIVLPPKCPAGTKWSANLKKCVPIIVLPPKCPAGTKWSANLKKCVPIIVLPIKCPAGTKWSANLKKCVPIIVLPPKCPAGTKWSANLKKCVPVIVKPQLTPKRIPPKVLAPSRIQPLQIQPRQVQPRFKLAPRQSSTLPRRGFVIQ
jgi:hypothetical protein